MNRVCAGCGELAERADRFCEGCGRKLARPPDINDTDDTENRGDIIDTVGIEDPHGSAAAPHASRLPRRRTDLRTDAERPRPCPTCGSDTGSARGRCTDCESPLPPGRDHVEALLAGASALTDRGLVRERNEDAYVVVTLPGGGTAAVVCDGVASVPGGAEASLTACEAAAGAVPAEIESAEDAARRSADAAREAVAALASGPPADPPACTYVGAVVTDDEVAIAWVGDSRAYWLADVSADAPADASADADEGSRLLTVDDSWASEVVALGLLEPDAAWADRRAHVITRWLAADAPDHPVHTTVLRPRSPGVLLLCSDGLWNHIPDAEDLSVLLTLHRGDGDLLAGARGMLDAALAEGGHDNVTIVLVAAGHEAGPAEPDHS